jgi:predicted PurR-regulated permease PerM
MHTKTLQLYFLLGLIALALVLSFRILAPFLAPLVLGAIFAVVLQPLYHRLTAFFKGRATLASFATVGITFIVLLVPLSLAGVQLVREAQDLYGAYSEGEGRFLLGSIIEKAAPVLEGIVPGAPALLENLSEEVDAYARSALNWIIQNLGAAFSGAAVLILELLIFFVTLYYLLRDGKALKDRLIALSPLADTDDEAVAGQLEIAVNSVLKGMLFVALIQGTLAGIGFAIFGVPNAVLFGLITAVAALVPVVGTALVLAPAVIYLVLTGDIASAIGLAIWGAVAVGLVDNFVGPRLMSSGMRLHPLLVLLSVLGGLSLFGPIGIFLGPLTLSFLMALLSLYTYLSVKSMKTNTEERAIIAE